MKKIGKFIALSTLFFSQSAHAQRSLPVGGLYLGDRTIRDLMVNFTNVLLASSAVIFAAIFLVGAFFYTISAGSEDRKGLGKAMMIGATLGAIVVAGSLAIFNFVLYFVASF